MRRNNKALYEQIMKSVSKEIKKALNEMESALDYLPQPGVDYDPEDNRDSRKYKKVYVKALLRTMDDNSYNSYDMDDAEHLYNVIIKYEDMCNEKFFQDEEFKEMYTSPFFAVLMLTLQVNNRNNFNPFETSWFEEVWEDVRDELLSNKQISKELSNTRWEMAKEVKDLDLNQGIIFNIFQWWDCYNIKTIKEYIKTGNI